MSCTDSPTFLDIEIGADASKTYELQSDGSPLDLTGATFVCKGRASRSSSDVVWTATVTLDVDPTTGRFSVEIPAATTATLAPGSGVWDLTMTIGSAVTVPIEDGTWRAGLRVSR